MKFSRLLTFPLFAALGLCASAATFEIEENFDDDSHFTNDELIPDGWASNTYWFQRTNPNDCLKPAHSGDNMFGCSNHNGTEPLNAFYTPLMEVEGGKAFNIEFMLLAPGHSQSPGVRNCGLKIYAGPEQDISKMTLIHTREPKNTSKTEYEKVSASFTPETTGKYCFAVEVTVSMTGGAGGTWFDDFFFTGTAPDPVVEPDPITSDDLEPDPENLALCQPLPFHENFSDETHYDGTGVLPIGWSTIGTTIWLTAADPDLPAYSGEYYMVARESAVARDESAYTPFFNLTAGTEYTLSFQSHFDGYIIDDESRTSTLTVTVGTEHDAEFHSTPLYTVSRTLDKKGQWVAESLTFTPARSGAYCFAFNLSGEPYSGMVCIDEVRITSPVDIPRPEPEIALKGIFSWADNSMFAVPELPVRFYNNSRYTTSATWQADDVTILPADDGSYADVIFPASGEYTVKLTAANSRSERSTTKKVTVTMLSKTSDLLQMLGYDPSASTTYPRGEVPSFDTDPNGLDYITGVNHYFNRFAERYDLPTAGTFNVHRFVFYITNIRYVPRQSQADDQRLLPFSLTFYGADQQGNLDENNVIYRKTATMGEVFNDYGFGGSAAKVSAIDFSTPVALSGTVYVAFEFDPAFAIDVEDANVGRSFVSVQPLVHRHKITTTYAKLNAVPADCPVAAGSWQPLHVLSSGCQGVGLNAQLWAAYEPAVDGMDATVAESAFSLSFDGSHIFLTGLAYGDKVSVYNVSGTLMLSGYAPVVDCSTLPAGVYVAVTPAGAAKFIK